MKVLVMDKSDIWGTPVCVVADGQCNHAATETEEVESYDGYRSVNTYCVRCGAVYNELSDTWMEAY